jgi:photosystem II stability/assembly factor-like uncharacterized protein
MPVYALAYDGRNGRRRIWAGTQSWRWGTVLRASDDYGKSWTEPETYNIKFPADCGVSLKNIWQIALGNKEEPDALYCGVEPSALFRSDNQGETWSLVRGLFDHPHRSKWMPGGGGQCLHTILPDPANRRRMLVAMSTGGIYRTDDGSDTWQARNQGIRAEFLPDKYPEFGQCVHKVVQHPARPGRYFLQNHGGLYRSDDGADSWRDIAKGLPSDFGFAMAGHPRDPDTVYIMPIESAEFRCTPEGKLRVYRTRNGGASWEPLTRGLPQKNALETVLRDGMATDELDPAGVYFGTRSGKLYGSADEGKSWKLILDGLPQIVCVKTAVLGEAKAARTAARPSKATQAKSKTARAVKHRPQH